MKARILAVVPTMLCLTVAFAQQPAKVETTGAASQIKLEQTASGYLTELNGKYKLRAGETTIEPGGHIGKHHHAGPGIRLVKSGQLTFVAGDKTIVYKAGDYFYESGDVTHEAFNKSEAPVTIIGFEILPDSLKGSSIMPSK
jgi:quercetin dioxygenase-like cupin family protein